MKKSQLIQIIKEEVEKAFEPKDMEPKTDHTETSMEYNPEDNKRIIGGLLYDDFIKMTGMDPITIMVKIYITGYYLGRYVSRFC